VNEFSRTRRLLKKNEFDQVFQHAKKLVSPHFTFLYRENTLGFARLGFALSKKMIAQAHDRTRIKRLLRETFRVIQDLPGVDVVVLARPKVGQVDNPDLFAGLQKSWLKLGSSRYPEPVDRSRDSGTAPNRQDDLIRSAQNDVR
jgi:ribonuclease P protein component